MILSKEEVELIANGFETDDEHVENMLKNCLAADYEHPKRNSINVRNAINKQIGAKPVNVKKFNNRMFADCKSCSKVIYYSSLKCFCPWCGQKIDWPDLDVKNDE